MKRSVALRGGALILVLALGFIAGAWVDQSYPEFVPLIGHRSVGRVDLTKTQQVARIIQADYVDPKVDPKKLSEGSVQGMVNSLGDPYSLYFNADQFKRLQQSYQGRYTGIGIYLSFATTYPSITGTVPGSPAALAGIKAGDQIVKVGDKDMKGVTPDQATALIQGPEGTKVTLTVARGTEMLTFTITRAEIQVPTVRSSTVGNHILYVRIYQFGAQTADEFSTALKNGLPGSVGMVLDLRSNPGGFVSAADAVVSQFVTSGETFETRGRDGTTQHQVSPPHQAPTIPLVVLVDANSASSSEIVAGSLQVHERAKLVGTKTFGKGSVQQDFVLADGSAVHLTVERWYLPNGVTIDKVGLTPDTTVALASPADAYDVTQPSLGYAKDTQLNAALAALPGG